MGKKTGKKSKPAGIVRGDAELQSLFREQLMLLVGHCKQFDEGRDAYAKHIAVSLRVLNHQTTESVSLLQQLGLRNGRFYNMAHKVNPRNLLSECGFIWIEPAKTGFPARVHANLPILSFRNRRSYPEWWNDPAVKARGVDAATMSRREIINAVANKDGGAHVDPEIDAKYHSFISGEFLGWEESGVGHLSQHIKGTPRGTEALPVYVTKLQYVCVRAIAHEFLLTMQKYARTFFDDEYTFQESTGRESPV